MKTIHIGNAVLCEYVARSENNKFTLVNTYSGDIIVAAMPANITLGLYLEIIPDNDTDLAKLQINLIFGRKTFANVNVEIRSAKKGIPALITITQFRLPAETDSLLKVTVSQEGYRTATAISKKLYLGEIPNPYASVSQPQP